MVLLLEYRDILKLLSSISLVTLWIRVRNFGFQQETGLPHTCLEYRKSEGKVILKVILAINKVSGMDSF